MRVEGRDFWESVDEGPDLATRARDEDPFVRWAAAVELASQTGAAAAELLRQLAGDSDEAVRIAAGAGLDRLDPARRSAQASGSSSAESRGGRPAHRESTIRDIEADVRDAQVSPDVGYPVYRQWRRFRGDGLSREREKVLFDRLAAAGTAHDQDAAAAIRRELINHNLGLAFWMASRLPHGFLSASFDHMDAVQEGLLGLLHALDRFDPGLENKFSTYGVWWARQGSYRASADTSRTIRLPVHLAEVVRKVRRRRTRLPWRPANESVEVLARDLQIKEAAVLAALRGDVISRPICSDITFGEVGYSCDDGLACSSIDADDPWDFEDVRDFSRRHGRHLPDDAEPDEYFWGDSLSDTPLIDVVADESATDASDLIDGASAAEAHEALEKLTPRERSVVEMRLGLKGEGLTLQEVGDHYGITRERARQIEAKALDKLRVMMEMPGKQDALSRRMEQVAKSPARAVKRMQCPGDAAPLAGQTAETNLEQNQDAFSEEWLRTQRSGLLRRLAILQHEGPVNGDSLAGLILHLRQLETLLMAMEPGFFPKDYGVEITKHAQAKHAMLCLAARQVLENGMDGCRLGDLFERIPVGCLVSAGVNCPEELRVWLEAGPEFSFRDSETVRLANDAVGDGNGLNHSGVGLAPRADDAPTA